MNWARTIPATAWMRSYRKDDLRGDLSAGLTTAVMLIPQAMAYAMLAGLPPIVGLYASTLPLVVYALFGSSRQLAVGPVAMVSMLTAAGLAPLAEQGTSAVVAYSVILAAMVGIMQLGMGLLRAGFLVNFLSHPVISGFTSAAALIIGFSRLKHLLGLQIPRSHHIHEIIAQAFAKAADIQPITVALGIGAVALLIGLKRWNPSFPRALAVVVVSTLLVWSGALHESGVAIVGDVPAGLPAFGLPSFDWEIIKALLPTTITISLVAFMESVSVAKAFARKHKYDVNANQELIGLGLANVAGALVGAYPVTGGFSRTAVNDQAGARTPMASIITAAIVGITLLFLTPLFHFLPKAVLAAIIMTAVFGLVDMAEVKHLWKVKRSDFALLLLTFGATLTLGIESGIALGVVAGLIWFVVRTTRPHTVVLGRLPNSEVYRNVKRFEDARTYPGLLILRIDAQFYFGNVLFLKELIKKAVLIRKDETYAIIIDASGFNQLDSSADTALHEIADELSEQGIRLIFAGVKGPVRDVMERSGFHRKLGREHFFFRVHDAVLAVRRPQVLALNPAVGHKMQ